MTTNVACDDKDRLLAYLYDEAGPPDRRAVEDHLAECAACRSEFEALRGVRSRLSSWTPPDQDLGLRMVRDEPARLARSRWRAPAWGLGLAAAAVIVLAAGAAVANLEVRYDERGVTLRTGWRSSPPAGETVAAGVAAGDTAPWRADLQALEERLRAAGPAAGPSAAPAPVTSAAVPGRVADETGLMRRVSALVSASEERQRRELALRMTDFLRDVERQRRADWVRIQQGFGRLEEVTGAGIVQQRELMNYVMRVSQRDPR